MAVRSVIDIDVRDDRFRAFMDLFAQYEAGLKKTTPHWKASERAAEAAAQATAHLTAEAKKREVIERQADKAREKAEREAEKAQRKRLDDAKRQLDKIKETTSGIAGNLLKGTASLVKWVGLGGLLGGLLGAGGLWGLGSLASSIGDNRKAASGIGVTSGELQSFKLHFGRLLDDPQGLMEHIADAQSDVAKTSFLTRNGLDPRAPTAELARQLLFHARDVFSRSRGTKQEADAAGFTDLGLSMADLRRLRDESATMMRVLDDRYRVDRARFAQTDQSQEKWQDFVNKLSETGLRIKTKFADVLSNSRLPEAIEKLSDAVADAILILLKSPQLDEWLKDFGSAVKAVAEYLGSKDFQDDIKTFITDFAAVAQKITDGLRLLHLIPDGGVARPGDAPAPDSVRTLQEMGGWPGISLRNAMAGRGPANQFDRRILAIAKYEERLGYSRAAAAGIAANAFSESGGNPFAVGDHGEAYGLFQLHAPRQKEYEKMFHHTMQSVKDFRQAFSEQLQFQNYEMTKGAYHQVGEKLKKYKYDEQAALAAGIVSDYYERPRDLAGAARERGVVANQLVLKLQATNVTGSGVAIQANQASQ